jgi:hypothetical protein
MVTPSGRTQTTPALTPGHHPDALTSLLSTPPCTDRSDTRDTAQLGSLQADTRCLCVAIAGAPDVRTPVEHSPQPMRA